MSASTNRAKTAGQYQGQPIICRRNPKINLCNLCSPTSPVLLVGDHQKMANHRVANVLLVVENSFQEVFERFPDREDILNITDDAKVIKWIESSTDWEHVSHALRVRIDGMVKTCKGFIDAMRMSHIIPEENQHWSFHVLGSLALCVRELPGMGEPGRNRFLSMVEELTTNTSLPLPPFNRPCTGDVPLADFMVQLFAELALSLLKLALYVAKHPKLGYRSDDMTKKEFVQLSNENQAAVLRLRAWCDRVRGCMPADSTTTRNASALLEQNTTASTRRYNSAPDHFSRYFQGRDGYFKKINETFATSPARPALVSLYGMAGIGKTQLAMRFCDSRSAYYNVIIWTEADTTMKIQEALSRHAVKLNLPGAEPRGDSAINGRILLEWLEVTNDTWLMVYDNLNDVQMLRKFWPKGSNGHIIVTSRDPYLGSFRVCASIPVLPLNTEESVNLFYDEIGRPRSPQRNQRIVKLLEDWNGVPLAINQMSSLITRVDMDLDDFVDLYSSSAPGLLQNANLYEEYPHSVATAFATEQLPPDAKAIMQAMCFFDPDRIPDEVIRSSFRSRESQGFNSVMNEMDYIDSLQTLIRRSLLTKLENDMSIHRLVQHVVYLFMSKEDREKALNSVLSVLSKNFPTGAAGQMWKDWQKCERYLPHAVFLCHRFEEELRGHKSVPFVSLVSAITWYLFERGLFAEIEPLVHIGLAACPDEESLVAAWIIWPLAGILAENNRFTEAMPLLLKSLKIRENLLPPNDPLLGVTYYSVGIFYMEDNQLEKSLEYNLKAVEVMKICSDPDEGSLAFAYGNLGLIYRRMGEFDKASHCMEEGEKLWRRSYGTDSDRYAICMYYLGNLRLDQGRIADARRCHQKSFDIYCKILPHNFKTGLCWHKMATLFRRDGDFSKAESHTRKALSIFEKCFDPIPRLARSTHLLSEVLRDSGRISEADKVRQEAEDLRRSITTLPYEEDSTPEAFERLVPYFLR